MTFIRYYHLIFSKPDVFFIQNIFIPERILRFAKNGYSKIFFDFDDAIYLDKNNPNAKVNTDIMLRYSDKIIVSNEILESYGKGVNSNTTIITTPVDTDRIYSNKTIHNETFTIGWIGSYWTTPYINIIKDALSILAAKYKFKLLLVGADKSFKIDGVDVEHITWKFSKELDHLNLFDIGIMPLTNDDYSSAKGGYKLLMYLSAGIPQIASPVGINKTIIIENKTGFLAENTNDWVKHISYFIENKDKCKKFGEASRELAITKYSREICFNTIKEIFKS